MSKLHARPTRRRFVQTAAAAIAFPYFVPKIALGDSRRVAASERIRMGFIGVGNQGGGHVGAFLGNKEVQILAICDVDRTKRDAKAKQCNDHYAAEREAGTYKGCDTYNNYEDLLARNDIDAVLIAVPDHWHAIIACAACRAGKDVYCEKPLALTTREA